MDTDRSPLLERLRSAADLLEAIDADRTLIDHLPAEDRERLHHAVAKVFNPDPVARRHRLKAAERERSAAKLERVGEVLHETGIRNLRRQPVFTTPNVFPPENFDQSEGPVVEPQHCYVCKEKYSQIHHF